MPSSHQNPLRNSLTRRLEDARRLTDSLFSLLAPEAILARPIRERHRVIFYMGHLEAFDWNLLGRNTFGVGSFDPVFDDLFAFGIDPVGGGLPDDVPDDWPARDQIDRYVRQVRARTDDLLADADLASGGNLENGKVFEVAIEHRLMHAETLAYMLHWLPVEWKKGPRDDSPPARSPRLPNEEVPIPTGMAMLGLSPDAGPFGWDNEFDPTQVHVPTFRVDRHNVSNGEFLEFLRSGGYEDRSLWSGDDWVWKTREDIRHPRFWELRKGDWMLRNMFDVRPLPLAWPVYVSHAEASAYARWRGRTLPTEAQFHRAAYGTPQGSERSYPWGEEAPDSTHGNFDFASWNPVPVGSHPKGNSAFGVSDLVGNGWEWTSSVFAPFEGFRPFEFYPGYSADFFDDKHFVMKGGSCRTSACMLRKSFRNWFQPHYPNIYATFRCVES